MNNNKLDNENELKDLKYGFRLFHYFLLISLIASVVIITMIGLGLHIVIRNYVICEAERDANRISVAFRDSIMSRFIQKHPGGENEFSVPEEAIEELDESFRKFLAPFNIVKIKVFDTDTQIIYSTDPSIIGILDKNNAKLSSALNGVSVSKYETKEHVWDLADEQRTDVKIVETYVPVYGSDSRVIGSFEIYKDVTTDLASATSVLVIAIAATSAIVFAIFAILIFLMRHAVGKINSMTLALTESNNELELSLDKRKRAKNELEIAKEYAEAANIAKSQFLANMSHEIRTPMNAIMGFSDILAEESPTETQQYYIDIIRNSCKHLLLIIDDILDFSKMEAGKLDIELRDCSINQLLNVIESMMHFIAKEKGLAFEIRTTADLPSNIITDSGRLQQCLINLTNNAIKFTEEGHVHLNIALVERNNQPYIHFDVEDTGIGIPTEMQEKVFNSFTQADEGYTRKYGGTGLGLAITKQLAKLLGGELTLTSQKGRGSVFTLVIPAGLDVASQSLLDRGCVIDNTDNSGENTEQPEFSGHVLVAEDAKTNQILIETLLNKMGVDVTIVENGNQALQKALTNQFDLILMDIQMPHMNGYEATKVIRKEGITTPIIAITANAMKGDEQKCLEAGCNEYLAKPIDWSRLIEMLDRYLSVKAV